MMSLVIVNKCRKVLWSYASRRKRVISERRLHRTLHILLFLRNLATLLKNMILICLVSYEVLAVTSTRITLIPEEMQIQSAVLD